MAVHRLANGKLISSNDRGAALTLDVPVNKIAIKTIKQSLVESCLERRYGHHMEEVSLDVHCHGRNSHGHDDVSTTEIHGT
ncbi:hypothetical protein J6524_11260 [Bradyrhizobium sp. WSM 1738]|uniref:hypothetical protein n=1 Tax=Bradyrhizobium hereditatis TaxID=2821405 RepID=UPI001CE28C3B|nr:hypothetical protein [Bradyrhizobium hereditatis]MCA6115470.1 hypothetical protein [Bradyrhizobium hereditatis]